MSLVKEWWPGRKSVIVVVFGYSGLFAAIGIHDVDLGLIKAGSAPKDYSLPSVDHDGALLLAAPLIRRDTPLPSRFIV